MNHGMHANNIPHKMSPSSQYTSLNHSSAHPSMVTKELNTMPHGYHPSMTQSSMNSSSMSQFINGISGSSSMTNTSVMSPSLDVNIDHNSFHGDVDMMDMSRVQTFKEEPAPLPRAIFKGDANNYRPPGLSRVHPLVNPTEMNVGREEIVTASASNSPRPEINSRKRSDHVFRQMSDESNSKQPNIDRSASYQGNVKTKIPQQMYGQYNSKNFAANITENVTPLAKLQQFTDSDSYIPDKEYNAIMEEKRRNEILYNRNNLDSGAMKYNVPVNGVMHNNSLPGGQNGDFRHNISMSGVQNGDFRHVFNNPQGRNYNNNNSRMQPNPTLNSAAMAHYAEQGRLSAKEIPKTFPLRSV